LSKELTLIKVVAQRRINTYIQEEEINGDTYQKICVNIAK